MLKCRVIPCLDVKDGRVVKGVNFIDLKDAGDPVESAIAYDSAGADELCFLDITASHENRGTILDVVRRTAEACFMPLTVGGGVRTTDDIRNLLLAGADKVSIMTAAVHNRDFVREAAEKFGSQCVVVAIDAKKVSPGRWEIFTHGGRRPTGIDAVDYAKEVTALGAGEILLTSMDRDGTRVGFDIELTRSIADAVPIRRRGQPRPPRRRHPRRTCDGGAGGVHLPFRRIHDPRRKRTYAAGGPPRPDGLTGKGSNMGQPTQRPFSLDDLDEIIKSRAAASADSSYTKSLLDRGQVHCARKFGEEAVEFIIATTQADSAAITAEAADVVYHLLVALQASKVPLEKVLGELQRRTGMSGHEEKAARG